MEFLIFFFQKKCLLPDGIFIFSPDFETWSRIFFRLKIFFTYFPNCGTFIYRKLIMSEVSAKSENFFSRKNVSATYEGFIFFKNPHDFETWTWILFR